MSVSSTYNYALDNVGPLTTVFSGPTTCLATTTFVGGGVAAFYVAAFWDDVTACYPSGTQSLDLHTGYFYSPGICPSGWAPIVSLETDIPKTASDFSTYILGSQTTAWLCCPSGYRPYAPLASSFWFYTNDCGSTILRGQTMKNVWQKTDPTGSLSSILASTTLYVLAKGIPIMWESTDKAVVDWWATASPAVSLTSTSTSSQSLPFRPLPTIPSGRTPDVTNPTNRSSISTTGTAAATSTPGDQGPSGSSLSTGAKAGIGVSAGIAAIAIGLALYFAIRLMRLKRAQEPHTTSQPHSAMAETTYKYGNETLASGQVEGQHQAWEMPTPANAHEISGRQIREMPDHQAVYRA